MGLFLMGFIYLFAMACKSAEDARSISWLDQEKSREIALLEKVDGLDIIFPEVCPECNLMIDISQVHMVDEITIMCPNCLTVIKGVLNE